MEVRTPRSHPDLPGKSSQQGFLGTQLHSHADSGMVLIIQKEEVAFFPSSSILS